MTERIIIAGDVGPYGAVTGAEAIQEICFMSRLFSLPQEGG